MSLSALVVSAALCSSSDSAKASQTVGGRGINAACCVTTRTDSILPECLHTTMFNKELDSYKKFDNKSSFQVAEVSPEKPVLTKIPRCRKGIMEKLREWKSAMTVEPAIVLFTMTSTLGYNVIPDMALSKIKHRNMLAANNTPGALSGVLDTINTTASALLGASGELDSAAVRASKEAADWSMKMLLIATVPAVLLVTLLGAWSDKHGRKVPIVLPILGYLLNSLLLLLDSAFLDASPENFLLMFIPIGVSGNTMTFMMAVSSYVAESSSVQTRTVRLAVMELASSCGQFMGQMFLGYIYEGWGKTYTFLACTVFLILSLIYVVRYVEEITVSHDSFCQKLGQFFQLTNIRDSLRSCFWRSRSLEGVAMFLLIVALSLGYFVNGGEINIGYYYVHLIFDMSPAEYGNLKACDTLAGVIGLVVVIPLLHRCFDVRDEILGAASYLNVSIRPLIVALAKSRWVLYLAYLTGVLSQACGATVRSLMSKIVAKDELGKVYSVAAIFDAAAPSIAAFIYPPLYKSTLSSVPSAVFYLSAFIMFSGVPALCGVWWISKKTEVNKPELEQSSGEFYKL